MKYAKEPYTYPQKSPTSIIITINNDAYGTLISIYIYMYIYIYVYIYIHI